MSWNAVQELRDLLSDNERDKFRYRQMVFPNPNGINKQFKTFEFRRLTAFTQDHGGFLGIYLNGLAVPASEISYDNQETGEFSFVTAPNDGDEIKASFFVQWFRDEELNTFLINAIRWLGLGDALVEITPGLKPAALKYAASEAYQKIAVRWSEWLSATYRVEDMKDPGQEPVVSSYQTMAKAFRDDAENSRNNFYQRQGQPLSPLWTTLPGNIKTTQSSG